MVEDLKRSGRRHPRRDVVPLDEAGVAAKLVPLQARVAVLEGDAARLAGEVTRTAAGLLQATAERDALLSSVSWRVTAPLRRVSAALRKRQPLAAQAEPMPLPVPPPADLPPGTDYARWQRDYGTLSDADRAAIAAHIARFPGRPLLSILIDTDHADPALVQATRASLQAQLYPHWEIREGTWHRAMAEAHGDFVAVMAPGDRLAEEALYEVAAVLNDHPETDLVYTDEDCVNEAGLCFAPAFKPDWNIELLLGQNQVGRLAVYRRASLTEAMCRETVSEHGLALAIARMGNAARIRHIPTVLYHRFTPGEVQPLLGHAHPPAWTQPDIGAVWAYLGDEAEIVEWDGSPPRLQIRWPLPSPVPRVSLIVPTRDNAALLARVATGLLYRTDYPDIELLIVDNDSRDEDALALLARLQHDRRVRVLPYPAAFNYAAINNWAVAQASGDIIVLINDDIDVIDGDWLREMVSLACRPDIGAVGARLSYGDGRIQHAGVILGVGEHQGRGGIAGHFGHGAAGDDPGYLDQYALTRELSAVTAACMALRREVFLAVGGFDATHLPIAYNDVDLCLRIRERGLRIIYTPFAALFHLESQSRGYDVTPEKLARAEREKTYMRDRWNDVLNRDPFYNPNFDWQAPMQRLAEPPRRSRPWRQGLGG